MIGLFVGAGFSSGLGMPLVSQLDDEIYKWLTSDKIRSLNKNWTTQGGGLSNYVIEKFAEILEEKILNYEQIMGWLQKKSIQEVNSQYRKDFHHLYVWMIDLVEILLRCRHTKNVDYIKNAIPIYKPLGFLVEENEPLWIFSLNHDLCMEILASELKIPIKTGIKSDVLKLPRRDKEGGVIGDLKFNFMNRDDLNLEHMDFFNKGEKGINLLKIHGSLDVFLYSNVEKYLKLLPDRLDVDGWIKGLYQLNNELLSTQLNGVRTINEIAFEDFDGEIQFLRRTILAGEYKFEGRLSQNTPPEMLELFKTSLKNVDNLIIIGYGFGDEHINNILEKWLIHSNNKIIIIDPFIEDIPIFLKRFKSRISIQKKTLFEWMVDLNIRYSISPIFQNYMDSLSKN